MVSNPSLVGKAEPGGDTGCDLGLWVRQLLEFGATTSHISYSMARPWAWSLVVAFLYCDAFWV